MHIRNTEIMTPLFGNLHSKKCHGIAEAEDTEREAQAHMGHLGVAETGVMAGETVEHMRIPMTAMTVARVMNVVDVANGCQIKLRIMRQPLSWVLY